MAETNRQLEVLNCLPMGEFISGEVLAQQLDLSRTAIWQAIKSLRAWGLRIDAVKGRGYCLRKAFHPLDAELIQAQLTNAVLRRIRKLDCAMVVGSTNTEVRNMGALHRNELVISLAEMQTGGQGRRGRQWYSPFAASIYLSLRTRLQLDLSNASTLGLQLCLAATERLQAAGLHQVGVKWPNDLYCEHKKLAGFLLEIFGVVDTEMELVIGFGLNVDMQNVESLQEKIDQPFTDMASNMSSPVPNRSVLAGQLIAAFVSTLDDYQQQALPNLPQRWSKFDILADRQVTLSSDGIRLEGIARGVDSQGRLRLETQAGLQIFTAGDISVRLS